MNEAVVAEEFWNSITVAHWVYDIAYQKDEIGMVLHKDGTATVSRLGAPVLSRVPLERAVAMLPLIKDSD